MRRAAALAVAIVVILIGDIVGLAVIDDESADRAWDPRVADIAGFVERARGLRFKRAVEVEFLGQEAYEKAAAGQGDSEPQQDGDAGEEDFEAILRAIGLMPRDGDLSAAGSELVGEATLAFYDVAHRRVVVRGTDVTAPVRVTVAHELTHALQDQYFSLDRSFDTDGEQIAFRALLEGDADRIESQFVESLSDADRQAWEAVIGAFDPSDLEAVPPAIAQLFAAPYALGDPLVEFIVEARGTAGLDEAIRKPPPSEEVLFDPFIILGGGEVKEVDEPDVPDGADLIDSGDFGSVTWFLMLASHVDDRRALRAVDGWGGDAYVAYKSGNRTCIRTRFAGDTAADGDEMAAALNEWKDAFPPDAVRVDRVGDAVEFQSCDTGGEIPEPSAGLETALVVPASRSVFATTLLRQDVPLDLAKCTASRVVAAFTTEQLASPELPKGAPDPARVGFEAGRACVTERRSRG